MGPIPTKAMHTHPPPLSEVAIFTWKMRNGLKQIKNHFKIVWFLVFEIWSVKDLTIRLQKKKCSKVAKFKSGQRTFFKFLPSPECITKGLHILSWETSELKQNVRSFDCLHPMPQPVEVLPFMALLTPC